MLDPGLILLDEPAAGVNPVMQKKLLELIHYLNEEGRTFLNHRAQHGRGHEQLRTRRRPEHG